MFYTVEQLQEIFHMSKSKRGWVIARNNGKVNTTLTADKINLHNSFEGVLLPATGDFDGKWNIHVSVDTEDTQKVFDAIYILRTHIANNTLPSIGLKMLSQNLANEAASAGKTFSLMFHEETELSAEERMAIAEMLVSIQQELQTEGVKADKRLPLVAGQTYFTYGNMQPLIIKDAKQLADTLAKPVQTSTPAEPEVTNSTPPVKTASAPAVISHPAHVPVDDIVLGVLGPDAARVAPTMPVATPALRTAPKAPTPIANPLEVPPPKADLSNAEKKRYFLDALTVKLQTQKYTREDILDIFNVLKQGKHNHTYSYIHQQRNSRSDRFFLMFKSNKNASLNEPKFWHTNTYQQAVEKLKIAYRTCDPLNGASRQAEENAFIDYTRGNAPMHKRETTMRRNWNK